MLLKRSRRAVDESVDFDDELLDKVIIVVASQESFQLILGVPMRTRAGASSSSNTRVMQASKLKNSCFVC